MALAVRSSQRAFAAILVSLVALLALAASASAHGGGRHQEDKNAAVGGKTTLALDAGTAQALTSLGIAVAPVAPSTVGDKGVKFPITGATFPAPAQNAHAEKGHRGKGHRGYRGCRKGGGMVAPLPTSITHSGGLSLTKGDTTVTLTDYTINLGDSPNIEATVNGGPRVKILSLDLAEAQIKQRRNKIVVRNVKAALTADAAGALNGAFGTDALTAGTPLGVAKVKLRLR